LVLKVDGMKKNDNDEPSVCRCGFGCCNTRKKKPKQQAQLLVLVSEVLAMKKNQDDELHLVVLV